MAMEELKLFQLLQHKELGYLEDKQTNQILHKELDYLGDKLNKDPLHQPECQLLNPLLKAVFSLLVSLAKL